MAIHLKLFSQVLLILIFILSGVDVSESARVFTIINSCKETIWPAVTPGDNFNGGGFALKPGQSIVFNAPVGWSGRIWGRTGCKFDKNGNGSCQTGACGTTLECKSSGKTPASLAEFTLANLDFYDVSLVDGFNLPITVTPINGKGNCSVAGCDRDLRPNCPSELAYKSNGKVVGCRSACDVFNTDVYCCRGVYGNPVICQPTFYSKKFKEACPTAYSYAYDDPTSIFTCSGTDYVITFCISRTAQNEPSPSCYNYSQPLANPFEGQLPYLQSPQPRKQPVCTYHNNKLVCSGSKGLKSLIGRWWQVMLASLFMVNLWIIF